MVFKLDQRSFPCQDMGGPLGMNKGIRAMNYLRQQYENRSGEKMEPKEGLSLFERKNTLVSSEELLAMVFVELVGRSHVRANSGFYE